MSQTIDAIIDAQGRIRLLEEITIKGKHRAKIIIYDEVESELSDFSIVGSMELLDNDLESASREISQALNFSIEHSAKDLNK